MAHIVSCMLLDADESLEPEVQYAVISKPDSQRTANELDDDRPPTPPSASEKPHVWRMHQPERKYQLFPKDKAIAPTVGRGSPDPEQALAIALGQTAGDKGTTDKALPGSALRQRMREHNLNRRRKVSVPDLGPMTTVQEVAMDSPTIPGRPPLHERSISAPGNSWGQLAPADLRLAAATSAAQKRDSIAVVGDVAGSQAFPSISVRAPLSTRGLAPLVIPPQSMTGSHGPRINSSTSSSQAQLSRLRSGSTPVEPPVRSARTDDSPKSRTPYTPLSASATMTTPRSAALTASTLPTPVSAPTESRASPRPWEKVSNYTLAPTSLKESSSVADLNATPPRADTEFRPSTAMGHSRNHSESGSIMERGRPRKRMDGGDNHLLKRPGSKRSKSAERRAFESLPQGCKAVEAGTILHASEAAALQRQALQQASRFEVLRMDDVDTLSRELRHLDERTEYLRRTYTSLRAGRRNLHSRICQYLRSPRTAKFSYESILKQEEALVDLDNSIDDWVSKLDQAENRRTRVRQKLLEHVAAAATLSVAGVAGTAGLAGASESLQQAMGFRGQGHTGIGNISTPPRSPTRAVFSPQGHGPVSTGPGAGHFRSNSSGSGSPSSPHRATAAAAAAAHVPSTILEQPLVEEAAAAIGLGLEGLGLGEDTKEDNTKAVSSPSAESFAQRRTTVESIRIYADSDVYALLADVESEISKMGARMDASAGGRLTPEDDNKHISDEEHRDIHRARSHELLTQPTTATTTTPAAAQAEPAATKESPDDTVVLTKAVFRPDTSVLVI